MARMAHTKDDIRAITTGNLVDLDKIGKHQDDKVGDT
jgi:hypothetical protein